MKKSLIVEISEGLGNQLFMYSNAFALAKYNRIDLLIDNTSGYFKVKNKLRGQQYLLDRFNIKQDIAPAHLKSDTFFKYFKKKLDFKLDNFRNKKKYLFEDNNPVKNSKRISSLTDFKNINLHNNIFLKGNFENENYFHSYRDDFIELFSVKPQYVKDNSALIDMLLNTNSISIHIRQNRFSDQNIKKNSHDNILKSKRFVDDSMEYIDRSIKFFNSKIKDPTFFVWSNDFTDLNTLFNKHKKNNLHFIVGNDAINDFNLFKYAKHFIVGPSTFHWWGAWLNSSPNKICLIPKNINPSNNDNFWPQNWLKI
jgi:hypothetical protein